MPRYIYEYDNWTQFTWDEQAIQPLLGVVRHKQGLILGQMSQLGFEAQADTQLSTLTMDVLKSSEIEGELLNTDQVRSSIARKLGIEKAGLVYSNRDVEGVVEMMLDATQNYDQLVNNERLFAWHGSLFPTGRSGLHKIEVAQYRTGEMQVISGALGKEQIHFVAPPHTSIHTFVSEFLDWLNTDNSLDPVLKAAVAHFWFIIIHPFDDGNGRIARALTDLLLARSDKSKQRYYSLSSQILIERKIYYSVLKKVQHSSVDITEWLVWFLSCLDRALDASLNSIQSISIKSNFWERHRDTELNSRQRFMLNKLLDGFEGKLKSSKWSKMTKCSSDTALRDIKNLIEKGILQQEAEGGRSTNYELVLE